MTQDVLLRKELMVHRVHREQEKETAGLGWFGDTWREEEGSTERRWVSQHQVVIGGGRLVGVIEGYLELVIILLTVAYLADCKN